MPSSPSTPTLILLLLVSSVGDAFVPRSPLGRRWAAVASLHGAAEDAYAAAEAATKKFGIGSKEAALAWETVDDVEDGGAAMSPATLSSGSLDEECDVTSEEQKCRELEASMQQLKDLTSVAKSVNTQIKSEILKLENLKLGDNNLQTTTAALNSDVYAKAKAEAEAASEKFGPQSSEAKVAWEAVFEVVSASDDAPVNMGSLEDECLLDGSSAKCAGTFDRSFYFSSYLRAHHQHTWLSEESELCGAGSQSLRHQCPLLDRTTTESLPFPVLPSAHRLFFCSFAPLFLRLPHGHGRAAQCDHPRRGHRVQQVHLNASIAID